MCRYLSATGYLHANIKPFFVALPKVQETCCCTCDNMNPKCCIKHGLHILSGAELSRAGTP
jgi:hypothetical protein